MKDGNRLAARDAGGEARGVFLEIAGGESEKIVDHDVNGTPDGIARKVSVIHGFGEDALPGKRRVAVHEQRKIFFGSAFAGAVLLGAAAADSDGINGLEVAGIGYQVNVNFVATLG